MFYILPAFPDDYYMLEKNNEWKRKRWLFMFIYTYYALYMHALNAHVFYNAFTLKILYMLKDIYYYYILLHGTSYPETYTCARALFMRCSTTDWRAKTEKMFEHNVGIVVLR